MKKKLIIILCIYLLPFILVWIGWIVTAFSYNPREIFQDDAFWGPSVVYWMVMLMLSPLVIETVNEIK